MSHQPSHPDDAPGQFSGRRVLLLLLLLVLLAAVAAVTFIRRPPGTTPAAVENRPFGPATRQEQARSEQENLDQPLLYRGSKGLEPEPTTSPAPADAAQP